MCSREFFCDYGIFLSDYERFFCDYGSFFCDYERICCLIKAALCYLAVACFCKDDDESAFGGFFVCRAG